MEEQFAVYGARLPDRVLRAEGDDAKEAEMDKVEDSYLLEEIKYIRARISEISKEITTNEYYYLFAIGAIYYFSLKEMRLVAFSYYFLALPPLICIYGLIRYAALLESIKKHDKYIMDVIEPYIRDKISLQVFGFVNEYYKGNTENNPSHVSARQVFWVFGIILSSGFFLYRTIG